jgi:SAM-dependent methyltransferase
MDVLVGHSYTWERAFIQFHKEGRLATPWVRGTYTVLDTHRVSAEWAGFTHVLTFDATYSQFTSVRTSDQNTVVGHRLRPDQLSTIPSLRIDYKQASTELCHMGKRYNVDKSSQRENPGPDDSHHCHPYSLFYHALFQKRRQEPLTFCEIGIAEGRSLLLWDEYFPNATIYGFEYMSKWLTNWKNNYSHKTRIHVDSMNVQKEADIVIPFQNTNTMFDCIIDDSSHLFYDMIRIIRLAKNFVKPGGMIIIEDVRREYDEAWFYNELKDGLDEFQTVFFVDLDHARRNSGDVNNDKLLVLVKKGVPIFDCSFF